MQLDLFELPNVKPLKLTTQKRVSLIIDRCHDKSINNPYPPLKEMLSETKRKYDNNELSWQNKTSISNLILINK